MNPAELRLPEPCPERLSITEVALVLRCCRARVRGVWVASGTLCQPGADGKWGRKDVERCIARIKASADELRR